jgi:predicted transcriptional regulator
MKIKCYENILTPALCRAGRALLDLNQKKLAEMAGLSQQTIADFERGARSPHPNNLKALVEVFREHGITFEASDRNIISIRFEVEQ